MSDELSLRVEEYDNIVRIYVSGEIDIYNTEQLKSKLYEAVDENKSDIHIDCEGLKYIDSTGLGIFVGALKRSREKGRKVYIENARDNIKKLFDITGLDKLFVMDKE
jgi:anti-sigma B factor antagonist